MSNFHCTNNNENFVFNAKDISCWRPRSSRGSRLINQHTIITLNIIMDIGHDIVNKVVEAQNTYNIFDTTTYQDVRTRRKF